MRRNELQPIIRVQGPQKWMRHVVLTQVAAPRLLDECQRPLPRSTQFRQHLFFYADHLGFERARRLAPDYACFDDHHRNMKPFVKRHGYWWFLQSLSARLRMDRATA